MSSLALGPIAASRRRSAASNYFTEVLADAPVAFWKLDDTASPCVDAVAARNGTPTNVGFAGAALVTGAARSAQFVAASSPQIVIADDNVFSPIAAAGNKMSIECVIKPTVVSTTVFLVSKATNPYEWGLNFSTGQLGVDNWSSAGVVQLSALSVTGALVAGTTYHLYAVLDNQGSVAQIWVNGVDRTLSQNVVANTSTNTSSDVRIGKRGDGAGSYFDGLMQGVAIYDKVLSSARIAAHAALRI